MLLRGGSTVAAVPTNNTSDEVTYQCPCGKQFKRKATFDRHLEVSHQDSSPPAAHRCNECGKTFGNENTLTMHMSVHETKSFGRITRRSAHQQLGKMTIKQEPMSPPTSQPHAQHNGASHYSSNNDRATADCNDHDDADLQGMHAMGDNGQTLSSSDQTARVVVESVEGWGLAHTQPGLYVRAQDEEDGLEGEQDEEEEEEEGGSDVAQANAQINEEEANSQPALRKSLRRRTANPIWKSLLTGRVYDEILDNLEGSQHHHQGAGGAACSSSSSSSSSGGQNDMRQLSPAELHQQSTEQHQQSRQLSQLSPAAEEERHHISQPPPAPNHHQLLSQVGQVGQMRPDMDGELLVGPHTNLPAEPMDDDNSQHLPDSIDLFNMTVPKLEKPDNFMDCMESSRKRKECTGRRRGSLNGANKSIGTKIGNAFACYVCGKSFVSEKYLSMHISLHGSVKSGEEMMAIEESMMNSAETMMESIPTIPATPQLDTPQTSPTLPTSTSTADEPHLAAQPQPRMPPAGVTKKTKKGIKVTPDGGWSCAICNKTFAHNSGYKNHMRTHSNERPYVCTICDIGFKEKYHLKKHNLFIHSNELPEKCRVCGKRFKDSTAVRAHERIHSDARPFACRRCNKTFKTSECLWHHEHRSKTCGLALGDLIAQEKMVRKRRKFKAEDQNHEPFPQDMMLPEVKQEPLDIPEHDLSSEENSHEQFPFMNGDFKSLEADFAALENIYMNFDSLHVPVKQEKDLPVFDGGNQLLDLQDLRCQVCHKAFQDAAAFQRHGKVHTEQRPYVCSKCDIGFKMKVHLKKHNLYVHSDQKPCECQHCGKRFKDSSAVRLHERTHSDTRPFECGGCGKAFKTRENLWGHQHRGKCFMAKNKEADMANPNMANNPNMNGAQVSYDMNGGITAHATVDHKEMSAQAYVSTSQVTARAIIENNQVTAHASFANNCVTAHAALVNNQLTAHASIVNNQGITAQATIGNVVKANVENLNSCSQPRMATTESVSGPIHVSASMPSTVNGSHVNVAADIPPQQARQEPPMYQNQGSPISTSPQPPLTPVATPMGSPTHMVPPSCSPPHQIQAQQLQSQQHQAFNILNKLPTFREFLQRSGPGEQQRPAHQPPPHPAQQQQVQQQVQQVQQQVQQVQQQVQQQQQQQQAWETNNGKVTPTNNNNAGETKSVSANSYPALKERLSRNFFSQSPNPMVSAPAQITKAVLQAVQASFNPNNNSSPVHHSSAPHSSAPSLQMCPSERPSPSSPLTASSPTAPSGQQHPSSPPHPQQQQPQGDGGPNIPASVMNQVSCSPTQVPTQAPTQGLPSGPIPSFQSTFLSKCRTPPPPLSVLRPPAPMLGHDESSIPIIYWDDEQEGKSVPGSNWSSDPEAMFHDISDTVFTQL